MPKSPNTPIHLPLVFLLVSVICLSVGLITLPQLKINLKSAQTINTTPTITPTPTITKRPPQVFNTLEIDPSNIAVGDKYQSLTLREIKSLSNTINNRSAIEITFQGELTILANPVKVISQASKNPINKICTNIRNNKIPSLPYLASPYKHTSLCFTNSEKLEKYLTSTSPITVTIDNITLSTDFDAHPFITATAVNIQP